jgi:hypothetical protein
MRPAYTHKEVGNRVRGHLKIGDQDFQFSPKSCLASSDWTTGFLNRITQWYFLSLAGITTDGTRFGLNLSSHIYDDASGVSQENALWLDGVSHPIGRAQFVLPQLSRLNKEAWHVQGFDHDETDVQVVDLQLQPLGVRQENLTIGLLASRFNQVFGIYSGTINMNEKVYHVDQCFGIAEKHFAKW